MAAPQPNPLELAKQGNASAIAFLINRSLKAKGIIAKPIINDGCLQIILEAAQIPNQGLLVPFIHKGVMSLEIPSINKLRVSGQQVGEDFPNWTQEFDLQEQVASLPVNTSLLQSTVSQESSLNLERTTSKNKIQQTNIDEKNHIILECTGENGILILTETKAIIKRKGGFISPYKKGEKHIPYSDIWDFQYQRSNLISPGYIYLQLSGLTKEITWVEANGSENSVTFLNDRFKDFDKVKDILIQKVNPQKYDNVFEGRSGTLILTETGVIIKRSGALLSGHAAGEKNIPYKSITAVQFKKAGITVGFLQLTLQGGVEAKGGALEAVKDENTITFGTEEKTQEFERAKNIIEQKIVEANNTNTASSNINDLDQLEKLASLKDKGIITEEEFHAKKKQILKL